MYDHEKKDKMLNLMRFWLFSVFIIVFASMIIYVGMFTLGDVMKAAMASAPIWLTTGILCVVWYYAYRWFISRE